MESLVDARSVQVLPVPVIPKHTPTVRNIKATQNNK